MKEGGDQKKMKRKSGTWLADKCTTFSTTFSVKSM